MKHFTLSTIAASAALALGMSVASADSVTANEPISLNISQMDSVTAGSYYYPGYHTANALARADAWGHFTDSFTDVWAATGYGFSSSGSYSSACTGCIPF